MLLALLVGAALALPPALLGPDGPLWVGPLPPESSQSTGPVVVVAPLTGQLWVEERLSTGAVRVWSGGWRLDGQSLTEDMEVLGHRFDDGRLISAPGAHGASQTYGYTDDGRLDTIRWPNGASLKVVYDDQGRVVSTTGPGPGQWRYGWGEALQVRDPLGRSLSIRTAQEEGQRIVTVKDALGRTARSRYAPKGSDQWQLMGWQDPRGLNTRIRRKAQQIEVQDPAGRVWRAQTNASGLVTQASLPGGQRWVWQRDDAGRVRRIDDPVGRITRWERDDAGRVIGVIRGGHQTRFRRDDAGRVIAVVSSSGGTTELTRDDQGRVSSIRDAAGNPVFFERHANGWPSSILGRTGGRWTVGLDLLGRPARFEDPAGVVRKIARNAAGHIQRLEHPVYGTVTFQHSQDRHLTRVSDGAGRMLAISWDGAGRPTKLEASGQTLALQWDPAGDLVGIDGGAGAVKIQRDPTGLVLSAGDVQWQRDLNGRVTQLETAGRKITIDRDPAGLIRGLRVGEWELDIHRDGVGWPVGWTGTDGTLDISRDGAGRIHKEVGERTLRVTRGGRGEVGRVLGDVGEWRWLRDAAGRVLRVHGGPQANIGFNRDVAGRVTLVRMPDGSLMRRQHLPDGVTEVVADAGGALIDARTTRWDSDGRLTSVTNEKGTGWVWQRSPAGQVTAVQVNDVGAGWTFGAGQVTGPAGEFMLKDAQGRVTEVQWPEVASIWGQDTQQLGVHYGALGQLMHLTGDAGQTQVQHDALGRLSAVRLPDGREWRVSYDVRGRPAQIVEPGGETHALVWNPAVDRPSGKDLLAVLSPQGTTRLVRGPGGSGVQVGEGTVSLMMTAEGEPAWRFEGRSPPQPLTSTPQGLGSGDHLRWIGPGGRLQLFAGGPLIDRHVATDPVSGARTDGQQGWPWQVRSVRSDGSEARIDPSPWSPRSPWSAPLALLTALGELPPIDDGPWWTPTQSVSAVPWLPDALDGALPPLGVAPHAIPMASPDAITASWLMAVLQADAEPDLAMPVRAVLDEELRLPWLPPGLKIPGLGSWGLAGSASKPSP